MRRLVSISAMLLVCLSPQSQDWEQVRDDCRYVWGEGWGTSLEEADRQALASLVSMVSVTVTSDYRSVDQQVRSTGGNDDYELLFNHQRVCSSLTLPYTQRTVLRSGRKSHVGRWILREDLESIFADRRDRILEYERCASAAEQEDRLGDALRCHWWAYMLLQSMQRPSEIRGSDGNLLVNLIPERMNALLSSISVTCSGKTGDAVHLRFTSNGKDVGSLYFSYFDGTRWIHGRSAKDGAARIDMAPGALADIIQLRIEYEFRELAVVDHELIRVMSVYGKRRLGKAEIIFKGPYEP